LRNLFRAEGTRLSSPRLRGFSSERRAKSVAVIATYGYDGRLSDHFRVRSVSAPRCVTVGKSVRMRMGRRSRCILLLSTGLFILALIGVPRTAHATCGDYLDRTGSTRLGHTSPMSETELPVLPCHGPHCSSSRPTPIPVPAPERIVQDRLAVLLSDNSELGQRSNPLDVLMLDLYTSPLADGIFHPPRSRAL